MSMALASVIVYVPGSGEPSPETVGALERQTLVGVEILYQTVEKSGPPDASVRNAAIARTTGAYVLELADGDVPAPTMIELCAWALETRPRAGCAVAGATPDPASGGGAEAPVRAGRWGPDIREVVLGACVFRRAALAEVGGFSADCPAAAADADLALRMASARWDVVRVGEKLVSLASPREGSAGLMAALRARHPGAFARQARVHARGQRRGRARASAPRSLGGRVRAKLEAEGLTDAVRWRRRPVDSALRFMPERLKGRVWVGLGLPHAQDMWDAVPALVDLPRGSRLSDAAARTKVPDGRTNVLVLHPWMIAGGAETVLLSLVTYMDRGRFDVHFVTTENGPTGKDRTGGAWAGRFAEQVDRLYHLPSFLEPDRYLRFVLDLIETRRIDVLLISLSIFGYNALPQIRARFPDLAVLDIIHAEAPYEPMDHVRLASRYHDLMDHRVVTTERVRDVEVERYGESAARVSVIANGVDTRDAFDPASRPRGAFRERLGLGNDAHIVLFLGRLAAEKQPMHIVEAAEALRDREGIVFVLVGDGPERAAVERAAAERGLANLVLRPAEDDQAVTLADATCTLFPSKREGLPMSGMEAMSMGVPVVASDVPGWADLVEDGTDGLLVADGDIAGYARAVARLVDDTALRDRMSAAARAKAVARYEVRDRVRDWERLLLDVRRGRPS